LRAEVEETLKRMGEPASAQKSGLGCNGESA
jgi:hypothetical protein